MAYRFPLLPRSLFSLSGAALVTLVGCGTEAPFGPDPATPPAPIAAVGLDTAVMNEGETPIYLASGQAAATLVRDEKEARDLLLGQLRSTYRLAPQTDFVLRSESRDERGLRYLRLQQLHDGIPVVGHEVVVQTDDRGGLLSIIGQLAPALRVEPALLNGDDSLQLALAKMDVQALRVHERPSPRVLVTNEVARIAFRTLIEYRGVDGWTLEELFVSAKDGAALARYPRVYRALERKVFDFKLGCLKDDADLGKLPGALIVSEGGNTMDPDARNVYDFHGTTYWYYKHFHGRDSYDDAGVALRSSVRVHFDGGGGGCSGANAAWIPDVYEQMVYGDGDGLGGFLIKNLTLALDVSAHELTHAVTSKTSNLTYQNETGALNEAMSDIQGSGTALWKRRGGGPMGNPAMLMPDAATWKIGAEVAGLLMPGGALRFMDNPTTDGQSKDYYPERILPGGVDNGGVHLNSGIGNLAHHLLSVGGTHPRGKTTVRVQGISIEKSLRIFQLANTRLFTSTTDFRAARYATAQAAATLYGRCGAEWTNVQRAWDAVGVPGAWTPCPKPPVSF